MKDKIKRILPFCIQLIILGIVCITSIINLSNQLKHTHERYNSNLETILHDYTDEMARLKSIIYLKSTKDINTDREESAIHSINSVLEEEKYNHDNISEINIVNDLLIIYDITLEQNKLYLETLK